MRTGALHHSEKAGLLEKLNEECKGIDEAALPQVWKSGNGANDPPGALLLTQPFEKGGDGVDGDRKDRCGVLFCSDFHERLQIA